MNIFLTFFLGGSTLAALFTFDGVQVQRSRPFNGDVPRDGSQRSRPAQRTQIHVQLPFMIQRTTDEDKDQTGETNSVVFG